MGHIAKTQRVALSARVFFVRRLMMYHNINATQLAERIGVAPQTVRAYLCGKRTITDKRFKQIKRKLSTSHRLRDAA